MVSSVLDGVQRSHTAMSPCGCTIYVSCHPRTGIAHTRIIERRGTRCRERSHEVGTKLRPQEPPLHGDAHGRDDEGC